MKQTLCVMAAFLFWLLAAVQAPDALASFFEGKSIRMIVSSSPGGGNDTYSRLIARHISKYIPGKPKMVVQNMPGGGGVIAGNFLQEQARRDGTVMAQIQWGLWHYQAIGDKRARFDFNAMRAVGAAVIENAAFYCRKDRYKSLEEIRQSGKLATVGVTGRQSTGSVLGTIIEKVTGHKLFDIVLGYPGARQYSLALRQGEIDCSSNTIGSFLDQLGDMWKKGELVVLFQAGTLRGERDPILPDVPMIKELATTDEQKETARVSFFFSHYGRPYALPPAVPAERVKLLRDAFLQTMQDAKFLAEAKKLHRPIDPLSGEELQEMWKNDLNPPPKMLEIVQAVFGRKK